MDKPTAGQRFKAADGSTWTIRTYAEWDDDCYFEEEPSVLWKFQDAVRQKGLVLVAPSPDEPKPPKGKAAKADPPAAP